MSLEQLSSYQIGKMLHVSRQAVNQWIDKGYIPSYRTPGGHRRVRREDLILFLKERKIPIPEILQQTIMAEQGVTDFQVMLVDNDEDFLRLFRHAIEEKLPAAEIVAFNNGYDALVAIGRRKPNLLVLDVKMPKIDGTELCRRLNANPLTQNLPIMVLTAHSSPHAREGLKSLQIVQIHTKSEPIARIADRISTFMHQMIAAGT